jgi:hypothetical protein
MVNQTVAPPFGLASDSITAVVCDVNAAAITGTLVGGGNFLLAIYPTSSIVTKNVVFVTPYYVIGGPIIEGSLDIDVPLGEAGSMPSRLKR